MSDRVYFGVAVADEQFVVALYPDGWCYLSSTRISSGWQTGEIGLPTEVLDRLVEARMKQKGRPHEIEWSGETLTHGLNLYRITARLGDRSVKYDIRLENLLALRADGLEEIVAWMTRQLRSQG